MHASLAALGMVAFAYNVTAWRERRERHLFINSLIYAAVLGFEIFQTSRHYRHRNGCEAGQ